MSIPALGVGVGSAFRDAQFCKQPPDSTALRRERWAASIQREPSFFLQAPQPRGARESPGPTRLPAVLSLQADSRRGPQAPRSREAWNLWDRGRQAKGSGPEPERGRAPRRRAVSAFHLRDTRQALGTFPRGQVQATGPRRGRDGPDGTELRGGR